VTPVKTSVCFTESSFLLQLHRQQAFEVVNA